MLSVQNISYSADGHLLLDNISLEIPKGSFVGLIGPNGDLYVVLHVEDDDVFERDDQNLIYTATITFPQAALGTRIQVPSINDGETLELDIPKGTQNGKVFTIRGKGLKFPGQNRMGDLLVHVVVKTPTKLSSRQEELLREFEKLSEEQGKGIFDKVKKAMGMD